MFAKDIRVFEVGGCVRDSIMGIDSNDIDFAVEAESFDVMQNSLEMRGFEVFVSHPEFLTVRARFPRHPTTPEHMRGLTADFVMCRKDSPGSDGRRPDFVEPGTILDDLARRDFTMNAIAKEFDTDTIIDPHDGIDDIRNGIIRFVGVPEVRIAEDGLRVMRAFRFNVTKSFLLHGDSHRACLTTDAAKMLSGVSIERVREELNKMLRVDIVETVGLIDALPTFTQDAIFRDGLRLEATLKD